MFWPARLYTPNLIVVLLSVLIIRVLIEQHWLSSATQNPSALESIQNLEASKFLQLEDDDDEGVFAAPTFVEHMNNISCKGGETARFECKVEPKNDPSLQISK